MFAQRVPQRDLSMGGRAACPSVMREGRNFRNGPLTVIEAGFELLPISRGFSGANDLDCGRAS